MLSLLVALGEADCEEIGRGLLAQPVNAISSLAFSVVGLALIPYVSRASGIERSLRVSFVAALVGTGVGSFLYHGPQTAGSQYLHDITFLVVLAIIALANAAAALGWTPRTVWTSLAATVGGCTVVLLVAPGSTNAIAAVAVLAVAAGHILLHRRCPPSRPWVVAAAVTMALALLFFLLGRSDGPLCDSQSLFQGHALWHVFSAVAVAAYFIATGQARTEVSP